MFKCVTVATIPKIAESDSTIKKIFWDTNHDARFESMRKNTTSSHVLRRHEDLRKRCEKEVRTYERWQKLAAAELRLTQAKYQAKLRKIRRSLKSPPPSTPTDVHVHVNTKTESPVRKIKSAEAVPHYVRSRETTSSSSKDRPATEITEEDEETPRSCSQSGTTSPVKPPSDGKVSPKSGGFRYFRESTLSPKMESVVESLRLSLAYIPDTPSNVCYAIPKSATGIRTPRPSTPWDDQLFNPRSSTPRGDRTFTPRASTPRNDQTFNPRASTLRGDQVFTPRASTPRGDQTFNPRASTPRGDQVFMPRASTPRGDQTFNPRASTPRGDQVFTPRASTPRGDQTFTPRASTPRGDRTPTPRASTPHGDQTFTARVSTPRGDRTPTPRAPTPRGDQEHTTRAPTPLDDRTLAPRGQTPRGNHTVVPGAQTPRIEVVGTTQAHKRKVNSQTRNSELNGVSSAAEVSTLDDRKGPQGELLFSVRRENGKETYTRKQKMVTFKF